jgi:hypothetical protein
MAEESGLILSANLESFFRDEITDARKQIDINISEMTEYYLVNLLCDYSRPDTQALPGEEPLAMLYKKALEASPLERIQILKTLGDVALYASGFFVEYIEQSIVDKDYYHGMGGSAYHSLADIMTVKHQCDGVAEIYSQLAEQFSHVAYLLNEISDRSRSHQNSETDLIRLYERWQTTGDEKLKQQLLDHGFYLGRHVGDSVH